MGNFSEFLESLGAFESGIDTSQQLPTYYYENLGVFDPARGNVDPSTIDLSNPQDLAVLQYHVHNTLGFLGKYQFGEPLLIDLGYYTPAPTGFYGSTATNEWQGTWTGKNGVYSKEDFMSQAQEYAIREAFAMNMTVIEQRLAQAGKTIDDYLGQEFTYTRLGEVHTAEVTMTGVLASAHLQGPGGVANLLLNNSVSFDEYGTNILFYMDKFGNYESPFGTRGDDILSGSDYSETFAGLAGLNVYTTGDGDDKIVLIPNQNGQDIVTDFALNRDVISLEKFNAVTFADLTVAATPEGHALIQFPDQQTLVLENIRPDQVHAGLFVQGLIGISWNANSGDTVIEHFNPTHDLIDLNYAFGLNNLAIYGENGSSVIEVVGNGQRLVLNDVPIEQLEPFNFIKAPIGFAEYFFAVENSGQQDQATHDQTNDNSTGQNDQSAQDQQDNAAGTLDGDVFSYTWNWGSHVSIVDFDPAHDVVDLGSFWTDYTSFAIIDDGNGNTVIDLTGLNNQTITLQDVALDSLSANNFQGVVGEFSQALSDEQDATTDTNASDTTITDDASNTDDMTTPNDNANTSTGTDTGDVFTYTWNWGSDDVIENFDPSSDQVDLKSFWSNYGAMQIYTNADGHAVIDLTDLNNQTITLVGVSAESLGEQNITGVSGSLSQALVGGSEQGSVTIAADDDHHAAMQSHQANGDTLYATDDHDVFSFTWNWGANEHIVGFDVEQDVVDLQSFWTSRDQVNISNDENGDAVIDLTNLNNQTITLVGVSSDDLADSNVIV